MSSASAPLVIDSGEGTIKVGLAGEEMPKVIMPSLLARPRASWRSRTAEGSKKTEDFLIGGKASAADPAQYEVWSPIVRGCVQNWEDMELLWQGALGEMDLTPSGRSILLADSPLTPVRCRERAAEILFERFGASALHFATQAVLALCATGATTGVVLDSGEGVTHAVSVCDGFLMRAAVKRSSLAGRDVTSHLRHQLRRHGYFLSSASQGEALRMLKEQHCYVTENRRQEELQLQDGHSPPKLVKLPDGAMIPLGAERFRAPEVLFAPESIGCDCDPLPRILVDSVGACDIDLRKRLWSQVSLAGGTTLTDGFGARMLLELRKTVPRDIKLRLLQPPQRTYSAWLGGSILGSLQTFEKMFVSKAQYQEHGGALYKTGAL